MKADKLFSELRRRRGFVEAYERLAPEYEIARQVMRLRSDLGLTQKQLAERAGTKQARISRLENAVGHPTVSLLKRIARALGVKLSIRFERPQARVVEAEMVDDQQVTVYSCGWASTQPLFAEPLSVRWAESDALFESVPFSVPVTLKPDATQAHLQVEAA